MDLSNINPTLILLLCGLCGVGIVIIFILQFFSGLFDIIGGLFGFLLDIVSGGPSAWCSCFVVVLGCPVCAGIIYFSVNVVSTCGTSEAVNFCRLIGQ